MIDLNKTLKKNKITIAIIPSIPYALILQTRVWRHASHHYTHWFDPM